MDDQEIFIVTGYSGTVFLATHDHTAAIERVKKSGLWCKVQYWKNGKHVFTSEMKGGDVRD